MLSVLDFAVARLAAVRKELRALKESEFPYKASERFVDELIEVIQRHLQKIQNPKNPLTTDEARTAAETSLKYLALVIPYMGIILRSSNTRNAFEMYGALQDLANKLVPPTHPTQKTDVILSSEWDYSPLFYPTKTVHTEFVLLGMPAPEAANPLLIPLAGHEIGHACWLRLNLRDKLDQVKAALYEELISSWKVFRPLFGLSDDMPTVSDLMGDLVFEAQISELLFILFSQSEEAFCDIIGTRVFGQTFIKAFAYLLSPTFQNQPNDTYPSDQVRLNMMLMACKERGMAIPTDWGEVFKPLEFLTELSFSSDSLPAWDASEVLANEGVYRLLYLISERAVRKSGKALYDRANQLCESQDLAGPNRDLSKLEAWMTLGVPLPSPEPLPDIVAAAWNVYEGVMAVYHASVDAAKTEEGRAAAVQRRDVDVSTLKELTLKSLELQEFCRAVPANNIVGGVLSLGS